MNLSVGSRPILLHVALYLVVVGLFCALSPQVAHAATILVDTTDHGVVVDGECSLMEAIIAANTNTAGNGCPAGDNPSDTIVLAPDALYSLTHAYTSTGGLTGLPAITSTIIISGNGATIERSSADEFRLLRVNDNLTLVQM